jgi:hypothetical protein
MLADIRAIDKLMIKVALVKISESLEPRIQRECQLLLQQIEVAHPN